MGAGGVIAGVFAQRTGVIARAARADRLLFTDRVSRPLDKMSLRGRGAFEVGTVKSWLARWHVANA
jgi:hypothetical protein